MHYFLRKSGLSLVSNSARISNRSLMLKCMKYAPIVTLLYTILWFCWTLYTLHMRGHSVVCFLLISGEVYAQWMAVLLEREQFSQRNLNTLHEDTACWYCVICKLDTPPGCHHCPLCDVCILHRDHHCFLLGTCICSRNMKHLIIASFYASIMCLYAAATVIPEIEEIPNLAVFFLPVTIGYLLSGSVTFSLLYKVFSLNLTFSAAMLTFGFGVYQLIVVASGKLPYAPERKYTKAVDNILQTFDGPIGFLNILIPFTLLMINVNKKTRE